MDGKTARLSPMLSIYHSGRIDASLPFDELRRRFLINEAARAANGAPDLSERIRASLPPRADTYEPSTGEIGRHASGIK